MSLSPKDVEALLEALKLQQDAELINLQRQQMTAAWISAVAAAVQALGAVATIWFSNKLARDAVHREALAEQRSQDRAIAADLAATRRAEEAEEREAERFAQREAIELAERNAAYNKSMDTILAHARHLIDHYRTKSEEFEKTDRGSTYVFTIGVPAIHPLRGSIAKARLEYDDAEVLAAIGEVAQSVEERTERHQPADAARIYSSAADTIEAAATKLKELRRPI